MSTIAPAAGSAPDPLAAYARTAGDGGDAGGRGDLFTAASPDLNAHWHSVASGLAALGQGDLAQVQSFLNRNVEDLGLAFRLTGDERERPWPLGPMPLLIDAEEWDFIEGGLIQRAELLERVIADIYGPCRLIADGHLPAALVSGSPNFARRMMGMQPPGGHHLRVYAVDLARGPTGEWRVLSDRTRLPTGVGYALENRLALTRSSGQLLAGIGTRSHAEFFEALRFGIAADCQRADPRIGLLTPGRFNQSYPEQAHLARHLGFSLVEGRDLTARDGRLYVRTIAGLKRIDGLWRWINTADIDPLAFDQHSQIGVPGLIDACRAGALSVANWPGAGVVESRAMSAFMPRLSKVVHGEPLALPNAATWWCGQQKERELALDRFDELVFSSSFRNEVPGLPGGRTRPGASLSEADRATLLQGMERRPVDYIAQEIVRTSTTPCLVGNGFEPRRFTLRAFLARGADGRWVVLPGGFARVSNRGELRTALMGAEDFSADVCIVEGHGSTRTVEPPVLDPPAVRRAGGLLPSQAADNLFWLGRYGERAYQTARVVRTLLETATGHRAGSPGTATTPARLTFLLQSWSATDDAGTHVEAVAAATLTDRTRPGSIPALVERGQQIALLLRDRLTRDAWRVIQRPLAPVQTHDADMMGESCDAVITRAAALARLIDDNMSRTAAWRFLDMGRCLERGSLMLQAVRAMIPGSASADDLTALLELIDGTALYRSRYLTIPFIAPVLDMVLLDPDQPRGLAYQIARVARHLGELPVLREDGLAEEPLRLARSLEAGIAALDADTLDDAVLRGLLDDVGALSAAIGRRYFLQPDLPAARDGAELLA